MSPAIRGTRGPENQAPGSGASSPDPRRPTRVSRPFRRFTRGSLIRLALFALALLVAGGCMFWMPGRSYRGPLPPLSDRQKKLAEELRVHVTALAVDIGERNVFRPGTLDRAATYVRQNLTQMGYDVALQPYTLRDQSVANVMAELPGAALPDQVVVGGAHYDTVMGSPGGNDNASGVAGLLALARLMQPTPAPRPIRFIAFVNEEPPFFQTEQMGSYLYAQRCKQQGERITTMMALDGIGCYHDAKGSQQYPLPIRPLYPSRGDFIALVSRTTDGSLLRRAIRTFRQRSRFPSEGAAMPGFVPGVGWSDHWSFWQFGYNGLLVTDTLPFRDEHYHLPTDTPERLDYRRMARVVEGLAAVVADLAGRDLDPAEL